MNIINRSSYSHEVKYGQNDWLDVLGKDGILICNIISYADKIDVYYI